MPWLSWAYQFTTSAPETESPAMYKVRTYNQISVKGLDRFPAPVL
jgi:hypothetical protein